MGVRRRFWRFASGILCGEILAAQNVALTGSAPGQSSQVAGHHILNVNDVQAAVDCDGKPARAT